jgi:hypothetical protein
MAFLWAVMITLGLFFGGCPPLAERNLNKPILDEEKER